METNQKRIARGTTGGIQMSAQTTTPYVTCTLKGIPCRHCSMATYPHIKRSGNLYDKTFKKSVELIELGLYCNNICLWIVAMKDCPIDTGVKLHDIPAGLKAKKEKGLLKFWKERGIDTRGLEGKK
jgi:hypothetical protein